MPLGSPWTFWSPIVTTGSGFLGKVQYYLAQRVTAGSRAYTMVTDLFMVTKSLGLEAPQLLGRCRKVQ